MISLILAAIQFRRDPIGFVLDQWRRDRAGEERAEENRQALVDAGAEVEVSEPAVTVEQVASDAAMWRAVQGMYQRTPPPGVVVRGRCPNEGRMCNCTGACFRPPPSSAASVAAPSPEPPAGGIDPAGVAANPPSNTPAGSPNEMVGVIAEVMDDHHPVIPQGFNPNGTGRIGCPHHYGTDISRNFPDWRGWCDHVAPLIAERIEKSRPPAPFTHDEKCESEFVFGPMAYSPCGCADRLADAADAKPNP